jgi:hypothetical protein
MKMDQTEFSETSGIKLHTPENNPKETYDIQNLAKVWNEGKIMSFDILFAGRSNGMDSLNVYGLIL